MSVWNKLRQNFVLCCDTSGTTTANHLCHYFKTWEEEIAKDKRFTASPKRESIRRWWKKECECINVTKKSRPMISEETKSSELNFVSNNW